MIRYLAIVLTCAALVAAQGVVDPEPIPGDSAIVSGGTSTSVMVALHGEQIVVQRQALLRPLTATEQCAISSYMLAHNGGGAENQAALCQALEFLTRIDQSHFPLSRSPREYLADYQVFTQVLNRVNWYVNLPAREVTVTLPPLPPVLPGAPELLRLTPGPPPPGPNIQPIRVNLQTPTLQLPASEVARQVVWVQPAPISRSMLVPERLPAAATVTPSGSGISLGFGWMFGGGVRINNSQSQSQGQSQSQTGGTVNNTNINTVNNTCPPLPGPPPQPPPPAAGPTCPPLAPGGTNQVIPQVVGPWAPVQPTPGAAGGP